MDTDDPAGADAVPAPPWWTSQKRRSARSALTREAVIDAALRVVDGHGLDGLSMRRVADELGTGPASLYWHVANKEQLINALLDRVIGEIPLPEPEPDRWEKQLRDFARSGREVFHRHPGVAQASLGRVPMGPALAQITDWLLALLVPAGIPVRPATWFGDLIGLYVGAHAYEATIADHTDPEAMGAYVASLPAERFPHLMASLGEMMAGDTDERFEFGLDLLIRGLASFVEER